ncbi:MAG: arginine--tRNA ligase [Cyanobacteriota bacterium]|nr:arginine--tRNA ligase [Cyanobacteriota bacterium]
MQPPNTSVPITQLLSTALQAAIRRASENKQLGALTPEQVPSLNLLIQIPNDLSYGDYASPSALSMAKTCRLSPSSIAKAIVAEFALDNVTATVAGAGFINFRLGDPFLAEQLQQLIALGNHFGQTQANPPEKILIEFVSANPTGPLHVGHGRWAAVGSTLANLFRWTGHSVDREFYINDAGNQMQILGQTLQIRVQQLQGIPTELPPDSYHGSYLIELAQTLLDQVQSGQEKMPTTLAEFTDYAYQKMLHWQQTTLKQFHTEFEQWFSERWLHQIDPETGVSAIAQSIQELSQNGYLYRAKAPRGEEAKPDAEEAIFFKTAEFGDDKDRVIQKTDGTTTYLAADIAYHRDKVRRGYDRLINILGSDHHGYMGRLHAAVGAFSLNVKLEIIIGQFVKLFRLDPTRGEKTEVRMSKRTGNFVSINDLMEDSEIGVGVDAARWFLLSNSMDSPINFDLDLAVKKTFDNPVVYVHYSHARCCTLLRRIAEEEQIDLQDPSQGIPSLLNQQNQLWYEQPEERTLLLKLLALPDELKIAAQERAPHKVIRYTESVASDFNKFYDNCRLLPLFQSPETLDLAKARLVLVEATRQVLYNLLTGILGISAPTSL